MSTIMATDAVEVRALGEPDPLFGVHRVYEIITKDGEHRLGGVDFQRGPVAEYGLNGVQHAHLLAIIKHRLECFQSGPHACSANAVALAGVTVALESENRRTAQRVAQGVEGTNARHEEALDIVDLELVDCLVAEAKRRFHAQGSAADADLEEIREEIRAESPGSVYPLGRRANADGWLQRACEMVASRRGLSFEIVREASGSLSVLLKMSGKRCSSWRQVPVLGIQRAKFDLLLEHVESMEQEIAYNELVAAGGR